MMKFLYSILALTLILFSCEREVDWDFESGKRFPVVDALITDEQITQEVKMFWSVSNLKEEPEPIQNAEVKLVRFNRDLFQFDTVYFIESVAKDGYYYANPIDFPNNTYFELIISHASFADTAKFGEDQQLVPSTTTTFTDIISASIEADWKADSTANRKFDDYYRYHVKQVSSSQNVMVHYYFDWSSNTSYCNQVGRCEAQQVFYYFTTEELLEQFATGTDSVHFPKETVLIRKMYAMAKDHVQFARELLVETDWRGTIFDPENGSVQSNFTGNVKGWFAVVKPTIDTLDFEAQLDANTWGVVTEVQYSGE